MTTETGLVLARITSQVSGLKTTGIAANLAAIKKTGVVFPAVFVVPKSRRGSNNRYMTGLVAQKREVRIQVVMAVRNISGAQGGKAITDIEQLYGLVDTALFGYTLSDEHAPLIFDSGAMLEMQNGEVWWIDEYVTWFDRRA